MKTRIGELRAVQADLAQSAALKRRLQRSALCRYRQEVSLSMSLFLNFFSNEIAIQTSIHLQKSASIEPRTGLSKFAKNYLS